MTSQLSKGRRALREYALLDPDAMTLASWQSVRADLQAALRSHEAIKPCCASCAHFDFNTEHCAQHDGKVPTEFQGQFEQCDSWLFSIPF